MTIPHPTPCRSCAVVDDDRLVGFFWSRVEEAGPLECWSWVGSKTVQGYGVIADPWSPRGPGPRHRQRRISAHRFAYQLLVGPVPAGLTLDHTCHNVDESCLVWDRCPHHACVNPAHLEPVTNRENVLRGRGPTALLARQTHCKRGHSLADVTPNSSGERICRPCRSALDRARWPKRRAARHVRQAARRAARSVSAA